MSRNSTGNGGLNPSANPARRSFLENLTSLPPRIFSSSSNNEPPLLHPSASAASSPGPAFSRALTPPPTISDATHDGGSPEHTGPAQRVSYSPPLLAPALPYARSDRPPSTLSSSRRSSFGSDRPSKIDPKSRPMSLSVNYVPAKFTRMHAQGEGAGAGAIGGNMGLRKRRKVGGGREAFADGAHRMGQMGMVDDDDGVEYKMARGGVRRKAGKARRLRWNRFKAILFAANTVIMLYGLATLVAAILVWLNVFSYADVIRVGNKAELIVSTVAAALCTLTAVFGYSGIILNNRAFLAVYTLLLWIDLGFIAAPGYMTYKQRTFNLEGKLNQQWSRYLGTEGRLRIQDSLICCGYFSPFIEASQSALCYARSNLPGCKAKYLRLERSVLGTWYAIAFSLVGAHIVIIVAALLCSNHVTYRFGKGLTPKRYRLDLRSMGVILDDYANQIAAQFGDGVAQEALTRSVSRGSGNHTPMAQDNLIDFAASRRGSFAPGRKIILSAGLGLSGHDTRNGTGASYGSQQTVYGNEGDGGYGGSGGYGQGGMRLVSQPQQQQGGSRGLNNGSSNDGSSTITGDGGGPEEWYQDADEDGNHHHQHPQSTTGFGGEEAGSSAAGASRTRASVIGWAT